MFLLTNVAFYLFLQSLDIIIIRLPTQFEPAHGDDVNLIENGLNLWYSHLSNVAAMRFKLPHC